MVFEEILDLKICVVGLGYVGLPLAVEFGKKYSTIGLDLNEKRIEQLKRGNDVTNEVANSDLDSALNLTFAKSYAEASESNVYIVTVPTPIDPSNKPDLKPLLSASKKLGSIISKNDVVIYESTVYPGVTEDECVPLLERISGLKFNKDFFVAYSPERINPGDRQHRLTTITKVVSGSTIETAHFVNKLYSSIISAGTYIAESIKVAEAAKVIENTQRDLNIALMNELSIIFDKLQINSQSVFDAAETKWNFLNFRPGLVGGHCIGVDPYYLTYKAEAAGHHPQLILAGRRINDGMGAYVAQKMIKCLIKNDIKVSSSKLLTLGLTFKENCPDLRNTKVVDVVRELQEYGASVDVYDPWCNANEALNYYGIHLTDTLQSNEYDGVLVCVAHDEFKKMGSNKIKSFCKEVHILFDLKNIFPTDETDISL